MEKLRQLYFPHDFYARIDTKSMKVRKRHGAEGYGVFWMLLEKIAESGGYLECDYESLSFEFNTSDELVESIVNDFDLFGFVEDNGIVKMFSKRMSDQLEQVEKKREDKSKAGKAGMMKRWKKQESDNTVITKDNTPITSDNTVITEDNTEVTNHNYRERENNRENKRESNITPSNNARAGKQDFDQYTEFYIDSLKNDYMKKCGIVESCPDYVSMENFDVLLEKFRSWMRLTERKPRSYGQMISTLMNWLRIEHEENLKLEKAKNNQNYGKSGKEKTAGVSTKAADAAFGGASDEDYETSI